MTSNKPFQRRGEVFGGPVVTAVMIDCPVHHAEVVNQKGDSYRFQGHGLRTELLMDALSRAVATNSGCRLAGQRGLLEDMGDHQLLVLGELLDELREARRRPIDLLLGEGWVL
ncbi:MAG TPA: ATP-binding protein [Acidimicrobiales bacterium]|nr:ATP-binding protein [Acidimicrobiales bacterium]